MEPQPPPPPPPPPQPHMQPFSTAQLDAAAAQLIDTGAVLLKGVLPPGLVREMRARFEPELSSLVDGTRERKPNEASGDGSTPNRNGFPGGPNRGPQRWFMSADLVQPYLAVLEATPLLGLMARVFGDDDIALTNIGSDTPLGRGSAFQEWHQDGGGTWNYRGEERIWRLGVRVPLVDVVDAPPERTNGPVEIIPNTVEMPIAEALERVSRGELSVARTPHAVGDIEVFNPRVVHRGSPNETDVPRYLLAFTFQPVAHLEANGAVGGGASAPSIAEQQLNTLSPRAQRMVRLLPRL